MAPTLERLRLLHAVATHRTIAAAARESGYTSSAVSQQLSTLERELRTSLIERSNRGVTLTPAGRMLSVRAAAILDLVQAATQEASYVGGAATPIAIRIAAFPTAITSLIVPAISVLDPFIQLAIVDMEPEQALACLADRTLDAAIIDSYDHEPARLPRGVEDTILLREPLRLVTQKGRPLPERLSECPSSPWILGGTNSRLGRATQAICETAGFDPVVLVETDDHRVTFDVMKFVDAMSLLPALTMCDAPSHVAAAKGVSISCYRTIHLVTRRVPHPHPAFDSLTAALRISAPSVRIRSNEA
jgi:DNA-binding transcriptional LysR family regulator